MARPLRIDSECVSAEGGGPVRHRRVCRQPRTYAAGSARIDAFQHGGQLRTEARLSGEAVGGELTAPADGGLCERRGHERKDQTDQRDCDDPSLVLLGSQRGHDQAGDDYPAERTTRLTARDDHPKPISNFVAKRHGAANQLVAKMYRVDLVA